MILFVELNYFFKVEPFASWYFPIVWFGFIFVVDAINNKLAKKSLIKDRFYLFAGMLILSALIWWLFEFYNMKIGNWGYATKGIETLLSKSIIKATISFATVIPAMFETFDLIRNVHLFDKFKLKKKHKITKRFLHWMFGAGIVMLILPLIWPKYFFPLVWMAFFFLLDPINYLHKQPSIIKHLKDRKLVIPLSLLLAGIICGFLWEFWNYWSVIKWTYTVPFVGFFKIFEMPILGYLGYFPFAFEIYAMWFFMRSLFIQHDRLLEKS